MLHGETSGTNTLTAELNAALAKAQANFKPIKKTKTAEVKGTAKGSGREFKYEYKYADLADCIAATLPALNAEELCVRQPIRHGPRGMLLFTELHHKSGQWTTDEGLPLPLNTDPQAFGGDLAYARRQGYCSMLCISPEEAEDVNLAANKARREKDLQAAQNRTDPASRAAQAAVEGSQEVITDEEQEHIKNELRRTGRKAAQLYEFITQKVGSKIPAAKYQAILEWFKAPPTPANVTQAFDILDYTPYERAVFAKSKEYNWDTIKEKLDEMIDARNSDSAADGRSATEVLPFK